jgi:tetrathionate reductase subunit B
MTKRYGLLVDIAYCLGCGICVAACKQENNLPPETNDIQVPGMPQLAWNQVLSITEGSYPELRVNSLPSHCNHCENPPCLPACPKEAVSKRIDGIVLIAMDKCNACDDQPGQIKKCIPACPYGAIQFNTKKNVVETCTFCVHRIEVGQEPACVRACLGRCLTFGDFSDSNSEVSQAAKKAGRRLFVLQPEKKTGPAVKYISPRGVDLKKISPLARAKPIYGYGADYVKPTV